MKGCDRTSDLVDFVAKHTETTKDTAINVVDVHFFNVEIRENPDATKLKELIATHVGEFNDVNIFDGNIHSYIELGGWIGDQEYALRFMALGSYLELWKLVTPKSMLPDEPIYVLNNLAGKGCITIEMI